MTSAQHLIKERPPWAPPTFEIREKDAAVSALQDQNLLDSFFTRLQDMCTLIAAAPGTSACDLSLAWQMIELKKVNVLVYGQTGAGKSTLIGELTSAGSLGGDTTREVHIHGTPSGICFVDRPGIDIPGAVGTDAESAAEVAHAGWYTNSMRAVSQWTNEKVCKLPSLPLPPPRTVGLTQPLARGIGLTWSHTSTGQRYDVSLPIHPPPPRVLVVVVDTPTLTRGAAPTQDTLPTEACLLESQRVRE